MSQKNHPIYPESINPDKALPNILSKKEVARSKLFVVEEKELLFSNGNTMTYEAIKGGNRGAVLVIAINKDKEALLIREYCGGQERYELAFPKGKMEENECIEEAANRELQEETGYRAERIEFLKSITIAPGYMGHITHILLAQDLHWAPLEGDEPELMEVYPWSLDNTEALIAREDFTEARSITALQLAISYLKNNG